MVFKRKQRRAKRVTPAMLFGHGRKRCPFQQAGITEIDYKDVEQLRKYIGIDCKIMPARVTGVCAIMQRKLTAAVKRARYMALLPYTDQHSLHDHTQ